ncbi:unnamed protein product [Ectocarpus sp. 13 AM-2016]
MTLAVIFREERCCGCRGGQDKAAGVYQAWLEARYLDFLRVLFGWIAEFDDFHRRGPALRTPCSS